jgi:hypothetical protein
VKIDLQILAGLSSPVMQALLPSASTISRIHFSTIDVACGAVDRLVDDDVEAEGEHSTWWRPERGLCNINQSCVTG